MPKQIKLEISRFEQISSARPLENAYHKKTGSSCEIENNVLVLESGEIYTASPELVGLVLQKRLQFACNRCYRDNKS